MSTSARAAIFARLRSASREASPARIQHDREALGRAPAAGLPAEDYCQAFLINVLRNRGTVDCARNRVEAVKSIAQYLYQHFRSQRLVAANDPRLAAMPWRDAGLLPRFGSVAADEPVALSFAQLGIAECGAVAIWTGKSNPGANNLLPEHHIVMVDAADLVADMEGAWDKINAAMSDIGRPRGVNFIAGPSSTADIEGQLVYGAHGPRAWHVILLGDITPGALEHAQAVIAAA